jgi:hypothetical protein
MQRSGLDLEKATKQQQSILPSLLFRDFQGFPLSGVRTSLLTHATGNDTTRPRTFDACHG